MEKTVHIIVPGTDPNGPANHRPAILNPDTTVQDLLNQLGLEGYDLSLGPNKPFLGHGDRIYDLIEPNGKIYATTEAVQG